MDSGKHLVRDADAAFCTLVPDYEYHLAVVVSHAPLLSTMYVMVIYMVLYLLLCNRLLCIDGSK